MELKLNDQMTSEAREEILPLTRKPDFSFSALFRQLPNRSKRYYIDRLTIWLNSDASYPAIFEYGSEASIVLEVSRNDVLSLIDIIENHILSDTENAYKLRRLGFWESIKLNCFGKIDKELPLSSNLLWVRRMDGFWLLTTAQFMGTAHGDSYSEKDWRKLSSVLTESLLHSSQP